MALIQQKKRQRTLLIMFGVLVAITGFILWFGFFRQPQSSPALFSGQGAPARQSIQVNFSVFDHPVFQELQEPVQEPQLPETVGRNNPFVPFSSE